MRPRTFYAALVVAVLTVLAFEVYAKSDFERLRDKAKQAGRDINKAVLQGGRDINKFAINAGKEADRVWDKINKVGDEICKEICKLGCGSAPSCGCECSGGVTVNDRGEVGGYNPQTGETTTSPPTPSNEPPPEFDEFRISLDPRGFWWVEHKGLENRYIVRRDYASAAVPSGVVRFHMPVQGGKLRVPSKTDKAGGLFWSNRTDDKQRPKDRLHASFDVLNKAGDPVYAPISGFAVRTAAPGKPGLTGLVIEQPLDGGRKVSAVIFYVKPTPDLQRRLDRGERVPVDGGKTMVGTAQNIQTPQAYGPTMPQHVHVSLMDQNGNYLGLDPSLDRITTTIVVPKGSGGASSKPQGNKQKSK
jgi:hypothetical protein